MCNIHCTVQYLFLRFFLTLTFNNKIITINPVCIIITAS